jgi:hypothetical protein
LAGLGVGWWLLAGLDVGSVVGASGKV